MAIYVELSL